MSTVTLTQVDKAAEIREAVLQMRQFGMTVHKLVHIDLEQAGAVRKQAQELAASIGRKYGVDAEADAWEGFYAHATVTLSTSTARAGSQHTWHA